MRRSVVAALVLSALLGVWLVALAGRGVQLMRTGEPVGVAMGLAILVMPALGAWLLWREWRMAVAVQRLADRLAADGRLPVDELPRSPGGRIDRAAADAAFEVARERVGRDETDWAAWYHLAFAYDAAGDRRRARESLRTAVRLHRASERGTPGPPVDGT